MQKSTLQFLEELLKDQPQPVYQTRPENLSVSTLKKEPVAEWVEEVYEKLEGRGNCWGLHFPLDRGLETEELRLSLDGPLHFNRYRAASLQSSLYQQQQPAWLENYRRYCRSAERECLKAGSRQGVWSSPEAEKHFGRAREAGDFSGPGAPGWKLQAFRDFVADVYLLAVGQQKQKFKRISLFERLMVQGQLFPLQQLLISRSESSQLYLKKYLSRQLEIPARQQKEP